MGNSYYVRDRDENIILLIDLNEVVSITYSGRSLNIRMKNQKFDFECEGIAERNYILNELVYNLGSDEIDLAQMDDDTVRDEQDDIDW